MSSESYTSHGEKHHSDDDRMIFALADFVSNHTYSKEEVQEAYFRTCGVTDEAKNSERIDALQSEMEVATKKRLPLNRLRQLIDAVEIKENGVENFNAFVEGLRITDKEKVVLRSIVEKRRSGTLTILSREEGVTLLSCEISISEMDQNTLAALLYVDLKAELDKLPQDLPIAVTFSEE